MSKHHTCAPKGKRVLVHMRSGAKIIAKFLKEEDGRVFLEGHEPIRCHSIRTIGIYKSNGGDASWTQ